MNKSTYVLVAVMLFSLFAFGPGVSASDLPGSDKSLIKSAGIPVFAEAVFVNGNQDVGFRFATSKSPEEVRAWYEKQLSAWSLYQEYGGWIIYEGKPGLGLGDLMMKIKQVQVQTNLNLSEWFGIDKKRSTEIVILIPR